MPEDSRYNRRHFSMCLLFTWNTYLLIRIQTPVFFIVMVKLLPIVKYKVIFNPPCSLE